MNRFFDKLFLKFILVGVINTIFGTAIMFVFYNVFHFSYWVSSASNYFFASILSYILNKKFTFESKETSLQSVMRFAINIIICYLLAYGAAKPLVRWIVSGTSVVIQDNVAMLAGMCFFVIFNYCGQRFFVFRNNGNENSGKHNEIC